jgi:hypothetical protein
VYTYVVAPRATFEPSVASCKRFSGIIQVQVHSLVAILTGSGNGEVDGSVCHEPGGTAFIFANLASVSNFWPQIFAYCIEANAFFH